jgi:tetratricopeptide (TPR) repeat protein
VAPRVALANLYFDAERYSDAVKWYEEVMKLDARNADASTDLGVSYYYLNQPDRALVQFEHSLAVNPRHTKTMLNLGIVRAFGKQDLEGASKAWQQVVDIAPASPEGQAAKRALEAMKNAHPDVAGQAPGT